MTTILSTTSFAEIHTSLKNAGFSENHAPLSALLNNEALNPTNALSTEDLAYAFNNSENLQLIAMSEQDMQNTQGAWSLATALSGASIGGLGGYLSYGLSVPYAERTAAGYATAIGSNLLGGAIGTAPIGHFRAGLIGLTTMYGGQQLAQGL